MNPLCTCIMLHYTPDAKLFSMYMCRLQNNSNKSKSIFILFRDCTLLCVQCTLYSIRHDAQVRGAGSRHLFTRTPGQHTKLTHLMMIGVTVKLH